MPIYEYKCRSCGVVTDVKHGFDETVSQACPACGGELARQFSPAGIVFKGSGFYKTDSRKAVGAPDSKPSGDGKSGETKSTDKVSETPSTPGASKPKTDGAAA